VVDFFGYRQLFEFLYALKKLGDFSKRLKAQAVAESIKLVMSEILKGVVLNSLDHGNGNFPSLCNFPLRQTLFGSSLLRCTGDRCAVAVGFLCIIFFSPNLSVPSEPQTRRRTYPEAQAAVPIVGKRVSRTGARSTSGNPFSWQNLQRRERFENKGLA
jgi:hypothetical protein